MGESAIIIKPHESKWGLFLNDQCIGVSKSNCDCVLAAHKLARLFEVEQTIDNQLKREVA